MFLVNRVCCPSHDFRIHSLLLRCNVKPEIFNHLSNYSALWACSICTTLVILFSHELFLLMEPSIDLFLCFESLNKESILIAIPDDKTGNHPLYCTFGDPFLQEKVQVSLITVESFMYKTTFFHFSRGLCFRSVLFLWFCITVYTWLFLVFKKLNLGNLSASGSFPTHI